MKSHASYYSYTVPPYIHIRVYISFKGKFLNCFNKQDSYSWLNKGESIRVKYISLAFVHLLHTALIPNTGTAPRSWRMSWLMVYILHLFRIGVYGAAMGRHTPGNLPRNNSGSSSSISRWAELNLLKQFHKILTGKLVKRVVGLKNGLKNIV